MSQDDFNEVENKEPMMYGYRDSAGKLLWTPNQDFAKLRAYFYGTYEVYTEKN